MSEALPGTVVGTIELPLVEVKVRELARALRDEDSGIPPTCTVLAAQFCAPGASPNELIIRAAGTDQRRTLLGDMSWTYRRPLVVGDVLQGTVRFLGSERKARPDGSALVVSRGVTTWRDGTGEVAVEVEVSLLCREDAPRSAE